MSNPRIKIGNKVECKNLEDIGEIVSIYDNGAFLVKFTTRKLPLMVIKEGSTYVLSTTKNPKWHKINLTFEVFDANEHINNVVEKIQKEEVVIKQTTMVF